MGDPMKNKFIDVIVCILLLATIIPLSVSSNEATNRTIYVNDDNTTGPWDGTMEHPYQFIQDAVDNAIDNDIIFVFSGIYNETITVDKTLLIKGENKTNTIIDGHYKNSSIVCIATDDVIIDSFTIQCSGMLGTGIRIKDCCYTTILNCCLYKHAHEAFGCMRSPYIKISTCLIHESNIGIRIGSGCDFAVISHCEINTNRTAVDISSSNNLISHCILDEGASITWGSNNTVLNCSIVDNDEGGYGIQMGYTSNNTLRDNIFKECGIIFHVNFPYQLYHDIDTSNVIDGKPIYYLVEEHDLAINETVEMGYLGLISCQNITVQNQALHGGVIGTSIFCKVDNCSIYENTDGISVHLSSHCTVSHCDFSNPYPVRIFKSSNITISNCTMLVGHPYGIGISIDYYSYDNRITDCHIVCFWDGIAVTGYSVGTSISGCDIAGNRVGMIVDSENTITKCNIYDNEIGLVVEGADNFIMENNFFDNTHNARSAGKNQWCNKTLGNFWDDWIGHKIKFLGFLPYRIKGTLCSNIDWHPAPKSFK
jgi:parallel beta-helix repeat protein